MMENSGIIRLLKQEGTSQLERYLPSLHPEFIKISDLGVMDYLRFSEEHSHFLTFISREKDHLGLIPVNGPFSTWKDFFSQDQTHLISKIASHNPSKIRVHYSQMFSNFLQNPLMPRFNELINYTGIWVNQLDTWFQAANPNSILYQELSVQITSNLSVKLKKLKEYFLATKIFEPQNQSFEEKFGLGSISPVWGNLTHITSPDQTIFTGNDEEQKLTNASGYINSIFESFIKIIEALITSCPQYLKDSLNQNSGHTPHMGLFLSFIQLLETVQTEINQLSIRHLEFYYSQFLQIPQRPPEADKTFILVQKTKGVNPFLLPKNTAFTAGKDLGGKPQSYLTDIELGVNDAQVQFLKTLFLEHQGNTIEKVYAAPIANSADGKGGKFLTDDVSWPIFGEKNIDLGVNLGFAIASPLWLMKEGERNLQISIKLGSEIMTNLVPQWATKELVLTPYFQFFLTTEKGWLSTLSHKNKLPEFLIQSVTLNPSGESFLLEIHLKIPQETLAPISVYNVDLHGGKYETAFPILRVYMDYSVNDAKNLEPGELEKVQGGLHWLQKSQIKSMNLQVGVGVSFPDGDINQASNLPAGLSSLKAAGDIGLVDTTKPCLPFGPTPSLGSSFYINSDEFSIKPIQEATFYLEWQIPENFASYYQPYGILYSESNFPIEVALRVGQTYKKGSNFNLFDANKSNFQTISLNYSDEEWNGDHNPALVAKPLPEILKTDISKLDGTIRFTLNQDFGHALYPQLIVGSLMETGGKLKISPNDEENLKNEINQHTLEFVPNAQTLNHLSQILNRKDLPENRLKLAFEAGLNLSFSAQNTLETLRNPIQGHPSQSGNNLIKKVGQFFSRSIQGRVGPNLTESAPNLNSSLVGIVHKETEIYLQSISRMASQELLAERAGGEISPEQVETRVKTLLQAQHQNFLDQIKSSTENLLKVLTIPPPPYTPLLKSLQLAYKAERNFQNGSDSFFHIHPFGTAKEELTQDLEGSDAPRSLFLFPNYLENDPERNITEGQTLIGLQGVLPKEEVSLFFQILDGSNKEFGKPGKVSWAYQENNKWLSFSKESVVSDSTLSFQSKGIVTLSLPSVLDLNSTLFEENQVFWVRASIVDSAVNFPRIASVSSNAVPVTFMDQGNDTAHYQTALPEGSINKLVNKIPEVSQIIQPVATFGGKTPEVDSEYFTRVSERLRHKKRAVTNWDYEHLVLDQFREVYKVKCINHYFINREKSEDTGKSIPGHVSLIVIPDLRNKKDNETRPLKPRVPYNVLVRVEEYLSRFTSPFVKVHAVNALFDEVKISCTVKFGPGVDIGAHIKKLNAELIGFLSPWTINNLADISFQVKVYASSVLDFIDKRPYILFATFFEMCLVSDGKPLREVKASHLQSIIVSAEKHDITNLET